MANRPVYISCNKNKNKIHIENVEFEWFPGFSVSQKQKSIKWIL